MARRRGAEPERQSGPDVRALLVAHLRVLAERWDFVLTPPFPAMTPRSGLYGLAADRLDAGESVVLCGWQLPERFRVSAAFVRVELDGSLTGFDEHPDVHASAVGWPVHLRVAP